MTPFKPKSPIIRFGTFLFVTFGFGVGLLLFTNLSRDSRYDRYDKNLVQLRSLVAAIEQYHSRTSTYPNTLNDLVPVDIPSLPKLRGRMTWYYNVDDDIYNVGFEGGFYEVIGGYSSNKKIYYSNDQ